MHSQHTMRCVGAIYASVRIFATFWVSRQSFPLVRHHLAGWQTQNPNCGGGLPTLATSFHGEPPLMLWQDCRCGSDDTLFLLQDRPVIMINRLHKPNRDFALR